MSAFDNTDIARAGIRNLYLKMVDFYTEALKGGIDINEHLLAEFNAATSFESLPSKSELAILGFVEKVLVSPQWPIDNPPFAATTHLKEQQGVVKFLISAYEYYGVSNPPEGFLQIDDGTKKWWKVPIKRQNGYFIYTQILDFDKSAGTLSSAQEKFNNILFPLDPFDIATVVKDFLINKTKEAYLASTAQGATGQITSKEGMLDPYFFILDIDSNSFHAEYDPNGKTGKLYIRTFFNEYGQKLASSILEITGIEEIKKVPEGIRKNFVIENMFSGIDAFEKYYTSEGPPTKKTKTTIDGLQNVKKIMKGILKKEGYPEDMTIGFIFTEDYKFITAVDYQNKAISNDTLHTFLKDNTDLNQYIARLNSINCQLVGDAVKTTTPSVGESPDNYKHFSSNDSPAKKKSPKKKASNYKVSRSTMKFLGDTTLKLAFEAIKASSPEGATVANLYETYFNKIDIEKLVAVTSKSLAKSVTLEDLSKMYFRVFIESLDITELIDCAVEQAGKMKYNYSVQVPKFDENGQLIYKEKDGAAGTGVVESETKTFGAETELDFERDLKTLFYGRFAFFYNTAHSYDSNLFNFPSSEPGDTLPSLDNLQAALSTLSDDLTLASAAFEKAQKDYEWGLSWKDPPPIPFVDGKTLEELGALLASTGDAKAVLEVAYLEKLGHVETWLDKNFPYIFMIPQAQIAEIYSVITTNDPQYMYNAALRAKGLLQARDTSGFSGDAFIPILFKNIILDYANKLTDAEFAVMYNNIASKNKKLKTTAELEDEKKKVGQGKGELGKVAKSNKSKNPKTMDFGWFNSFENTIDYSAIIGSMLGDAFSSGMQGTLQKLVQATSDGAEKEYHGDEDALNILPPDQKSAASSNDPIQNILDAPDSTYGGAPDLITAALEDVFPNLDPPATAEDVKCLFEKIASQIPLQVQLKLVLQPIDPNDSWTYILQNIFISCNLPNDIATITNFFIWLFDKINESGALDIILQKSANATEIISSNTAICDNNDPQNPFKDAKKISDNEARAALKQLYDLLSLLSDEKRKSSQPKLFSCPDGRASAPVFDDHYDAVQLNDLNKTVKGNLKAANKKFNQDISKFKSIVLKQNLSDSNAILDTLGSSPTAGDHPLKKFMDANNKKLAGDDSGAELLKSKLAGKQKDLKEILKDLIAGQGLFFDTDVTFYTLTSPQGRVLNIYSISASDKIKYKIVVRESDGDPGPFPFDGADYNAQASETAIVVNIFQNTTNIFVTRTDPYGKENIIFHISPLGAAAPYDLPGALKSLLEITENKLNNVGDLNGWTIRQPLNTYTSEFQQQYNASLPWDLPGFPTGDSMAASLKLLMQGGDALNPEYGETNIILLNGMINTILTNFIASFETFDTEGFSNIPLKDNEAKYLGKIVTEDGRYAQLSNYNTSYSDGGILSTKEIFDTYKDLRKQLQCYIGIDHVPGAHQIASLKTQYEVLFNIIITEDLLQSFFLLDLGLKFDLTKESWRKKLIVAQVKNSFYNTVNNIGSLQDSYEKDLRLIYKYDIIAQGITIDRPTTWPSGFKFAESIDDIIVYFIDKYYLIIVRKIATRINVSIPGYKLNEEFGDMEHSFLNRTPDGGLIWPMYNEVQLPIGLAGMTPGDDSIPFFKHGDDVWWEDIPSVVYPLLDGLESGFIVQRFVDIRQNGELFKTVEEDATSFFPHGYTLDEVLPITFPDYPNEALGPIAAYPKGSQLTGQGGGSFLYGITMEEDEVTKQQVASSWSEKPLHCYSSIIFAVSDEFDFSFEYKGEETGYEGVGPPGEANIPKTYQIGPRPITYEDIDTANGTLFVSSADPTLTEKNAYPFWPYYMYKTQGKINISDYNNWHTNPDYVDGGNNYTNMMEKWVPETYYKKATVGLRLCMVIDPDEVAKTMKHPWSGKINDLMESYRTALQTPITGDSGFADIGDPHAPMPNAKHVMKDKIGPYRRPHIKTGGWEVFSGKDFFVIPIYELEGDALGGLTGQSGNNWMAELRANIKKMDDIVSKPETLKTFLGEFEKIYKKEFYSEFLPIALKEIFDDEYGDQLNKLFNSSKEGILSSMASSKAVMNAQWDYEPEVPGAMGEMTSGDNSALYAALAFSIFVIAIQAGANVSDPTWKTPWFWPGPLSPIGYLAKILSYSQ